MPLDHVALNDANNFIGCVAGGLFIVGVSWKVKEWFCGREESQKVNEIADGVQILRISASEPKNEGDSTVLTRLQTVDENLSNMNDDLSLIKEIMEEYRAANRLNNN